MRTIATDPIVLNEEVPPALEYATGYKENNNADVVSPIHHIVGREGRPKE